MSEELKRFAEGLPERRHESFKALDEHQDELAKKFKEEAEKLLKLQAKELDKHADRIDDRLHRFFSKALIAFAIIGMCSAFALLGFGYVLSTIQHQRFDAFVLTCKQQNEQHDRAIRKAEEVLPKRSQATVFVLVDQLRPFEANCQKYARMRVKGNH